MKYLAYHLALAKWYFKHSYHVLINSIKQIKIPKIITDKRFYKEDVQSPFIYVEKTKKVVFESAKNISSRDRAIQAFYNPKPIHPNKGQ